MNMYCRYCKVKIRSPKTEWYQTYSSNRDKGVKLYIDEDRGVQCLDSHYPNFHQPMTFKQYYSAISDPERKERI